MPPCQELLVQYWLVSREQQPHLHSALHSLEHVRGTVPGEQPALAEHHVQHRPLQGSACCWALAAHGHWSQKAKTDRPQVRCLHWPCHA